jgi:phenylacetate-coenzyme A ligase PaaK-like adenylate-forming protein
MGGPPPGGVKAAIVAAGSAVHVTGAAPAMSAGHHIAFTAVPVTLPLAEVVARLNALQPQVVMGYPGMLARLAHERAAGRLAIRPFALSATSEMLTPELRATIEAGFETPLANTFGSSEGLVGHGAPGEAAMTFNSDMCLVELVDAANRPVPPGVASAKVLVTNLVNLAQPLIRYELSDQFVQVDGTASGYLQAEVEGRSDDVLRFGRVAIHPHVLRSVLVRHPQVADYQARQTPRGVDLSVLLAGGGDLPALAEALRAALTTAGLADAEVTVQPVATLPSHPQTGKLRRIVPLAAEPARA